MANLREVQTALLATEAPATAALSSIASEKAEIQNYQANKVRCLFLDQEVGRCLNQYLEDAAAVTLRDAIGEIDQFMREVRMVVQILSK